MRWTLFNTLGISFLGFGGRLLVACHEVDEAGARSSEGLMRTKEPIGGVAESYLSARVSKLYSMNGSGILKSMASVRVPSGMPWLVNVAAPVIWGCASGLPLPLSGSDISKLEILCGGMPPPKKLPRRHHYYRHCHRDSTGYKQSFVSLWIVKESVL